MQLSRLGREQIADELTKHVGRKISLSTIDAWTADTKQHHLPADCVPALCEILQDDAIQRQLLSAKLRRALELGESGSQLRSLITAALEDLSASPKRRKISPRKQGRK